LWPLASPTVKIETPFNLLAMLANRCQISFG